MISEQMICLNDKIVDQLSISIKNEVIFHMDEIVEIILDEILEYEVFIFNQIDLKNQQQNSI